MIRGLFLFALFRISLANSFLLGYSPTHHFACAGIQCPEQTAKTSLPSLLARFQSESVSSADLPLHSHFASQAPPSLLLVVRAELSSPRHVLSALAKTIGGDSPTSFLSRTDAIDDVSDAVTAKEVADLNLSQKNAVVNVQVKADETDALINVIKSRVTNGDRIAVVWASREEADAADAAPADQPPADGDAAKPDPGTADDAVEKDPKAENYMNRPEISSAGFAGLLVTFIFLLIFIPGFLCLTKITAPETFEIMDSNDMKKKMQ